MTDEHHTNIYVMCAECNTQYVTALVAFIGRDCRCPNCDSWKAKEISETRDD